MSGLELAPDGLSPERIGLLCRLAFASAGIEQGHAAVTFVGADRIQALNLEHRGRDRATDVLSFPVDGAGPTVGPRELGDVIVHTGMCESVERAVIHGALHLAGMDHESDRGEMLAIESEIMRWVSA